MYLQTMLKPFIEASSILCLTNVNKPKQAFYQVISSAVELFVQRESLKWKKKSFKETQRGRLRMDLKQ